MTALWIIAAVLFFLWILLMIPVYVHMVYDGTLQVWIGYLFLKKQAYPQGEQKPKKEKTKKKKDKPSETQEKPEKEKTKQSLPELLQMVGELVNSAKKPLRILLRGFTVYHFRLHMTVLGEDASETAIRYGQMNAFLYGLMATLKNAMRIKDTQITLVPLFGGGEEVAKGEVKIRLRPATVLRAGILFGASFLYKLIKKTLSKNKQRNKAVQ